REFLPPPPITEPRVPGENSLEQGGWLSWSGRLPFDADLFRVVAKEGLEVTEKTDLGFFSHLGDFLKRQFQSLAFLHERILDDSDSLIGQFLRDIWSSWIDSLH
ncbi:MAG: hypothetical protein U0946_06305, partial [Patescibacteria group bacterium]|nr:hypothetical protein [Patescibacteria group bacterium]